MANVASVTKYFAVAKEGFTTTLGSTITSGAPVVPLNSVSGYTNGDVVALVVDPTDVNKKQVFTGTIDTTGIQITGVVWTEGSNQTHSAGATVVDYTTATHQSMMATGIKKSLNDDGSMKLSAIQAALGTGNVNGYTPLGFTPNTVTYNGNRSYDLVFNGVDLTGTLSNGMRLRTTRTVAAPTQCTNLNGTSQYYTKTAPAGMTFTDDFVAGAWIKMSSYPAGNVSILSRYNGTSGWNLNVTSAGQVYLQGYNAGSGNWSLVQSYQSLPLNKWVNISAQLDMSAFTVSTTTSYVMFDGIDVPSIVSRAGTNPVALIQAGDLQIGASNGSAFFPGKIAQAAVFNSKVTQATMRTYISQGLLGTESTLISAYSFNNSINDLNTTNANNLTANGGAVATNADSPFTQDDTGTPSGTNDFGIVTKKAFATNSTITVQVPEGCTIPTSGGVSAVVYSSNKAPFGFPTEREKWRVKYLNRVLSNTNGTVAANTWFNSTANLGSPQLIVPTGAFELMWSANAYYFKGGATLADWKGTLSTANNTESDTEMSAYVNYEGPSGTIDVRPTLTRTKGYTNAAATPYYFNVLTTVSAIGDLGFNGANGAMTIIAEPSNL